MRALADPNGSLCAVWVTNDPELIYFASEELLPSWGFRFVTAWVWVKVTQVDVRCS
jgi:N6-adenosine-specific RNA methylase IME4